MPEQPLSDLTELLDPHDDDLVYVVDVSDISGKRPSGRGKRLKLSKLDAASDAVQNNLEAHEVAVNPHNITPIEIGAETPVGAQAKVDAGGDIVTNGYIAADVTVTNNAAIDATTKANAAKEAAIASSPPETDTSIGILIDGATTKSTPVDADEWGFRDSVSGLLRKISHGVLKALFLNRANHTGTQALSTISDAGTMAAEDASDYITSLLNIIEDTTTALTLDASNQGLDRYITLSNASPIALTVDAGTTAGMIWQIRQIGAGVATATFPSGTVNGNPKTAGQHTTLAIVRRGTVIDVIGGVA